jgi:hypothetical protein
MRDSPPLGWVANMTLARLQRDGLFSRLRTGAGAAILLASGPLCPKLVPRKLIKRGAR